MKFIPTPKTYMDRDTIEIKSSVGGTVGQLSDGAYKAQVLKLKDNLYVTTDKAARKLKVMGEMEGKDIHIISTRSDMQLFLDRYAIFRRGEGR